MRGGLVPIPKPPSTSRGGTWALVPAHPQGIPGFVSTNSRDFPVLEGPLGPGLAFGWDELSAVYACERESCEEIPRNPVRVRSNSLAGGRGNPAKMRLGDRNLAIMGAGGARSSAVRAAGS